MRGSTILTTVLVLALLSTVFFVAAGLIGVQLGFSSHRLNRQELKNLAESTAALGVARLLEHPDFQGTVVHPTEPGACVTFNVTEAQARGLPLSHNNLQGKLTVPGAHGAVLGPETAQLVAVARLDGQQAAVEVILEVPRFPYEIASSGPIACNGGLLVAALDSPSVLAGPLSPADLRPGTLVSNDSGTTAVDLRGANVEVIGDVQAGGEIHLDSQVSVTGEVRPHSDKVELPHLDVHSLDIAGQPGLVSLPNADVSGSALNVSCFCRRAGSLTIHNGLQLGSGVLFVDGDLTVDGGISGRGAVICSGKLTVHGGGSLGSQNFAALVSGGDLKLEGTASDSAAFQGMVYTGGHLTARYAEVAGLMVAETPNGQSSMTLENSKVYHVPQSSVLDLVVSANTTVVPGGPGTPASFNSGMSFPASGVQGFNLAMVTDAQGNIQTPIDLTGRDPYDFWMAQRRMPDGSTRTYTARAGLHQMLEECWNAGLIPPGYPRGDTYSDANAFADAWINDYDGYAWPRTVAVYVDMLNRGMVAADAGGTSGSTGSSSTVTYPAPVPWSLDLSQFLNLSDRIRVKVWREIAVP